MHAGLPAIPPSVTGDDPVLVFHPPVPLTTQSRKSRRAILRRLVGRPASGLGFPAAILELHGAVPVFSGRRPRTAAVLYDLIPLLFYESYLTDPFESAHYSRRVRQMASTDLLLAISQSSADDATRLIQPLPRVVPISGTTDPYFEPHLNASSLAVLREHGLNKPSSSASAAMTTARTCWEPSMVSRPCRLRCGTHTTSCSSAISTIIARTTLPRMQPRAGVGSQVQVTGFVPDDDLLAYYRACRLFFFPSRYEGLGLPILEALRCGAPVVTGDNSSLREFAGDVSWYCDVDSPASMAKALTAALAEPKSARAEDRVEFVSTFTWESTARRAASAIEESQRVMPVPRRPRSPG